jgi:2-keto-4-pentenoate hydratase
MVLEENGEVISTGAGAAVLGNPAQAVANLANRWADFDIGLKAGDIVISGTPVAAVPAEPGDFFEAIFDRLGAVSVRFV